MLGRFYSLAMLVTLLMWPLVPQFVISADKDSINIYWSDLGINQWQPEARLGDSFSKFDKRKRETIIISKSEGQILIPMPPDNNLPKTEEGWGKLSSKIYQTLKSRIIEALECGLREFEVRTEQNIDTGGYFNPWRQDNVVKFIQSFCLALDRLKTELSSKYNVTVYGIWGSNGGYAASKVIPELKPSLVDGGILVDPRAWETDVKRLYTNLGGNLAIINTAGDAPARNHTFHIPVFHLNEKMVAYHQTSKALKRELPGLKVYWVDCKGLDVFFRQHLSSMHWDNPLLAKEFTAEEYINLGKLTGGRLRDHILSNFKTRKRKNLKNLKEALSYPSPVLKRERKRYCKSGDFPPGPPPPPPLSSDTTLSRSYDGPGGVYIDITLSKVGRGHDEIRQRVLNSRPSDGALCWPIETPKEE